MIKKGSTWGIDSVPGREAVLDYLVEKYTFKTVIDVGCGKGDFFHYLNKKNIEVEGTGIDMIDEDDIVYKDFTYIKTDFINYEPAEKYDLIFSSHTIEHNPNTDEFIKNFFKFGKDHGIFCLVWPPPKPQIVGGHVHVFNLGLMLYNIIRTGVDCSNVEMIKCGYNLCLVGKFKFFELPELTFNRFEIDMLKQYFPFPAEQAFNGDMPPGIKILTI